MKRILRILARGMALGVLALAAAPWPHAPALAAATKTHHSAKYGYAISYPAGWNSIKNASEDLNRESPDGNAFLAVAITTLPRPLTPSELKKLIANELVKLGATPKAIVAGVGKIHGVTFYDGAAVVKGSGAKLADIFLVTQRHNLLYIFNGGWALGTAKTKLEDAQVNAGLGSITFANG